MENKLIEITKLLADYKPEKIKTFLTIAEDIDLSIENKIVGLLYYCHSANILSIEEIIESHQKSISDKVKILLKLDKLNYSQQLEEAENLRKMFFAITKDIRIIMIKIAFIVTELRFVAEKNDEESQELANSIFALFAPLSARLGMTAYKTELENGAFMLKEPELYQKIQKQVENRFKERHEMIEKIQDVVEKCMNDLNIEGKISARKKHIYSIHKKLQTHSFDQIYDLLAMRVIVNEVSDCYALLGRLHSIFEPCKDRFKDYIATPKPNGYQSLHTTVIFEGFPIEIQIRTQEMHHYAEYGVAAHWIYKEKRNKQDSLDVQLAWLRQMMESDESSIDELASSLNQDIYNNEIFVQTPKGKVIYLPNGSTPIDFAYSIHSEIGNKCVGAKVNGKMTPVVSTLQNGDVVEIITNPHSKGPSRDWLKICKTSEARNKINNFFKKNMKEETIKLGKSMLESAIKEKGYSVSKLTSNGIDEILKYYNMNEVDELYANIGTNAISSKFIANKLAHAYQKQIKASSEIKSSTNSVSLSAPSEKQISLKGLNNILLKFANCCHPMYGDDIVGFISQGRGVIIHRSICPNVGYFRQSRLIEATWKIDEK